MAGITESCSVCGSQFDVQFRYQMEERDGGFSFFCSQKCLETSQVEGAGAGSATCDACAKRFTPDLVSQVLYVGGRRRYACGIGCRSQLLREAKGARLGDIAPVHAAPVPAAPVHAAPVSPAPIGASIGASSASSGASSGPSSVRSTTDRHPAMTSIPAALQATAEGPRSELPPSTRPSAEAVRTAPSSATPKRGSIAPKADGSGPHPIPGRLVPATGAPRVIAVFNHKGGTGKTTTAVSVAAGLALKGAKVLLVDTDAQGNVSVSLGAGAERSLYHVLVMGLRVSEAVKEVRPNLDLLPSNETLAAAELYLAGRQNRDRVLFDRLAAASQGYDFVVLDCSPSLSLMNQNALVFADSVLVPVACDYLSLVGVRQVIKTVKNVNALLHHPVQIWGVLPTFYDSRAKICREAVSTLKQHFGDRCLTPVRAVMKVKEAPAQGQTIFEYAQDSYAAEDYAAVVEQIVQSRQATGTGASTAASAKPAATA